ncbi:MAG: terminase small subunit [Oscillospiraceae bacterium]|nr:terminase small subunit [Oscillospiraceae bacterium]
MSAGLKEKELLFCRLYSETLNPREAAARAGYLIRPEYNAFKLLNDPKITEKLEELSNSGREAAGDAAAGLRRIAFGSVSDAVTLLYAENADKEQIEQLDLFNVAEIKRPKGGGMEIKFFDRIKALEKLMAVSDGGGKGAGTFIEALERSAKALQGLGARD